LLADERELRINGRTVSRTPILLPSFSSKGLRKGELKQYLDFAEALISEEALISAYDLYYDEIFSIPTFPSVLFVDSGGYETSAQADFSEVAKRRHKAKKWNPGLHATTLSRFPFTSPTVVISYDHRVPVERQIAAAKKLLAKYPYAGREILIKPNSAKEDFVDMNSVGSCAKHLGDFDVIGFTETELGPSTFDRMINIARLRRALVENSIGIPIHIFGSLDPISSPLYFLSGADIFDGLTWLRYAFNEGYTIYKHNYAALNVSIRERDDRINAQCATNNYYYLMNLKDDMLRYLGSGELSAFRYHAKFLELSFESLKQKMGI